MLRVGLTGGIGAGKSTVSRLLVGLGAVLVDADVLAREVVAPGTPGLEAVAAEFGPGVLAPDGSLDRPALGRVVFGDDDRRAALNAIVHPLVAVRRAELAAAAPDDAVVVEDVPLLVETGAAPTYPLVVVVDADAAERERRLVTDRGMDVEQARARIAAQAGDEERRAAADVLLPNPRQEAGAPDPLPGRVERLWRARLVPFEEGLRTGRPGPVPAGSPTAADRERVLHRLARAGGPAAVIAEERWPLGVFVSREDGLAAVGYVRAGQGVWASADPGCAVRALVTPGMFGAAGVLGPT
ncbi:dephospho-CoA kinase [Kineococcus sp. NPDC059986]|uniref:dephospho-CoA kinase n=1 Tax=Kineococcus sp. NPDC059986 TaxID=3155538 RepID=UPI00344DEFB5